MWWNNDWNSSSVISIKHQFNKGYHKVVVYGSEGCCDGPMDVRFNKNGGEF
jgi:uncharacterized protein (DUF779 family)